MSEYIGSIGSKVSAEVQLVNKFEYTDYKFSYYGTTHYTYIMKDAEGNILVWKTTSVLMTWDEAKQDNDVISKGDTMLISGKVKEHSEYKGIKQTVLTRCKFSLVAHAPDPVEVKREQQMQSLEDGDFIWKMPYRQYKEHYSDCETVAGSFDDYEGKHHATIEVIIRKGRLKNSGVRGEHFKGFLFQSPDRKNGTVYRAVCEENAQKRLLKDHPDRADWECTKIYDYRKMR